MSLLVCSSYFFWMWASFQHPLTLITERLGGWGRARRRFIPPTEITEIVSFTYCLPVSLSSHLSLLSFIHSFINNQFNNPSITHPSMLCLISAADCLVSSLLILCLFYSRRFFSPTQTWPSASQPLGSFPMAADKHSYISSSSVSPDAWRGQNNFSKFDIISC